MSELKIAPLFSVPFGYSQFEEPDALCAELRELFLARDGDANYRNQIARDTQVGLFESKFDLHNWPEPCVQRAFAFIHGTLAQLVQQLNQYPPEIYNALTFNYHTWFHVTRSGGHQGAHNHPMASWSGIFCVDPGDSPADDKASGSVRFLDTRAGCDMFTDAGNRHMLGQYHLGGFQTRHEMGRLILFPSWVLHEVFAYRGTRPRIVIAFNAWIDGAPQELVR